MRKWLRRIWVAGGLGFVAWLAWNAQAHGVAPALLASGARVTVADSGGVLQFLPAPDSGRPGLIFLPGGAIDPVAYVPLLRAVAVAGHPVALVRLPWRMAPTEGSRRVVWERIRAVVTADSGRRWVLAGHSRGAALAARFVGEGAGRVGGLVLIATTHPKRQSLATVTVPVMKIYGTRDCVAKPAEVLANAGLLPADTRWVPIEGGNHRQFAHYGDQLGDCDATISREAQQALTLQALREALAPARPLPRAPALRPGARSQDR